MTQTKKAKIKVVVSTNTEEDLKWRRGKPKTPRWYNASRTRTETTWRWFDGKRWSQAFIPPFDDGPPTMDDIKEKAYADRSKPILYRTYWPDDARIPRPDR